MEKPIKKNNSGLKSTFIGIGIFLIFLGCVYCKEPYEQLAEYIFVTMTAILIYINNRKKSNVFYTKISLSACIFGLFCVIYEVVKLFC